MRGYNQNVIKHKTGLLNLAAKLGNISKTYNLDHKAAQSLILARYSRGLPAAEKVIPPSDLMNSGLLEVVDIN